METDRLSRTSLESASTGDEFVVVNAEPKLRIANNGNMADLEGTLTDVLTDDDYASSPNGSPRRVATTSDTSLKTADHQTKESAANKCMILSSKSMEKITADILNADNKKGYDPRTRSQVHDLTSPTGRIVKNPFDEKERALTTPTVAPPSEADEECTIFHNVTYLGSATVNAPRSENEIRRNMAVLNEQSMMSIPVTLSVPHNADGIVKLLEPNTKTEIATFKIYRILFCARCPPDTDERNCFAFTYSHGDKTVNAIFQCHVFSCDQQEAVSRILYRFATSFRRLPKSSSVTSELSMESSLFKFQVTLDVKENDSKGNYYSVPKDRNIFKLRCNVDKKISITVQQVSNVELRIERCFGLLISPGRIVKNSDMHLIDMVSMGNSNDGKSYVISGDWDPSDPAFQVLNTETMKDTRVFMTIAVDLVFVGIQEPVRFLIETKARIHPTNERFWVFNKKPIQEQFHLHLKDTDGTAVNEPRQYDVVCLESQADIDRRKTNLALSHSPARHASTDPDLKSTDPDESSDGEEPLPSGSGVVSKDVTDEQLLETWHDVLTKWHQNLEQRPKQVESLCRKGVPEALRAEVWQLLSGCRDNKDMYEAYRILISKDSASEQVILRDINRTFPAHDFFRETGGIGQDALYKISKAYSIYDEEINYCQGLSFLAASLLLHMPEEQAFCILIKVMFDYGHRELFRQGFEELHLKFYQLERLMQDHLSDLHRHFQEMGLEAHMFASQWFLTLFTAKFPLYVVFHILDIYLSEGMETIFRVALALLKSSRKDLLALDFEGALKYFRVQLPKKFRSETSAKEFMQLVVTTKVKKKKVPTDEKEYTTMKEQELESENPIERMEQKLQVLQEVNLRLEQENDDLAHELVTSKIALRNDLDNAEDRSDYLNNELLNTNTLLVECEEEKKRLEIEAQQLKEMCRREMERSESEATRNSAIITDYKQICSRLSERLEKQQTSASEELNNIKTLVEKCDNCSGLLGNDGLKPSVKNDNLDPADLNPRFVDAQRQIRELELELAQTKLAFVESECKTQDLTHDLNSAMNEIQSSKNTWFSKTFNSLKEATTKKDNINNG